MRWTGGLYGAISNHAFYWAEETAKSEGNANLQVGQTALTFGHHQPWDMAD